MRLLVVFILVLLPISAQAQILSDALNDSFDSFSEETRSILNERAEAYRNPHEFSENYLQDMRNEREFDAMKYGRQIVPQARKGIQHYGGLENAVKTPQRAFDVRRGR